MVVGLCRESGTLNGSESWGDSGIETEGPVVAVSTRLVVFR